MKTLVSIPLILAGLAAAKRFDLTAGATCADGYEPITTRWQDCAAAARSMGFKYEALKNLKYNKPWGTTRPQGCFRKGNGKFQFNDGQGGNFKGRDKILCVLKGQGPKNPNKVAGSSLESGTLTDISFEEAAPEGAAPAIPLLDVETNGGMAEAEIGAPRGNATEVAEGQYKFYSEDEGWTEEAPISRNVCGGDDRKRIGNTKKSPWKWIVDLIITAKNGKTFQCTGFFIAKRAIMTSAHCVYMKDHGGWVKHVQACPGRDGGGGIDGWFGFGFPYGCQYVNHMWATNNWVNSRNSDFDYATMSLPNHDMYNKGVGYFGYTTNLSNVGTVNVAGYPGDKDSGTTLQWNYSSYTTHGRKLHYMADTNGGMSGGPVWAYFKNEDQRRVVGVHGYGGCPNKAVRVNGEVFDWMQYFRKHYN